MPPDPLRVRNRWPRLGASVFALAAVAAAGLLVVHNERVEPAHGTLSKAVGPSVTVYVKRGERVFRWDRQQPLQTDDELRLQVRADGYRYVTVWSVVAGQPDEALYEGVIKNAEPVELPMAWKLVGSAAGERIRVTFSAGAPGVVQIDLQLRAAGP